MKKFLSLLLLALPLGACAPAATPPAPSAAAFGSAAPAPVSTPRDEIGRQVAVHLRAGRHQAALALIDTERRRRGSQALLQDEELQILQELSRMGEELFQAGEYERSGRIWALMLSYSPMERTGALGIGREALRERLELCSEHLMAQGLSDYRAGDLPAAIGAWKKILTFHGTHEGARKGIQTAEIQLQNLRALH